MGMMSSLRRLGKRRPVLGILFVVVLSIGLVGSYAIFSTPKAPVAPSESQAQAPDANQQAEAMQKAAQEQISKLETDIANLQKDLQAKPGDIATAVKLGDSQYNLGTLYLFVNGDQEKATRTFKAAVATYQQVLKLNPAEKGINLRLAGAALYAGDSKLAEDNFQAAIKADPNDNNARMTYGMYLASMKGDYQGAIDQWQEILKHNPDKDLATQVQEMIKQAETAKQDANKSAANQPPANQPQANGGQGSGK
ncbi:tetratricopeptide repeat protein [Neomoorella thermoacetica]|uniref:Cellulose synthase subunit BcsC n=2 Tax=Neomoorella thermoacetica TaxID=1525 RepID=A0A1J5NMK3_NEOTH|nr:tetratricopeptide repeat protein [Moorella thermoacetica]APC07951.1 cellulose synthase subunit BcsC [Moorella thermoacetica]OIQ12464.1 cellulose synthase subunit BcsC [Moorella thermoacetica]OIQ59520.1 cellulose synthase subunit BcsC [Moorella thermoacetica]OIQ61997.1 cellulose synthase subunit BcsC [Moorella thermoacetica]